MGLRSSEGSARVWLLGLLSLLAIAGVTVLLLALLTHARDRGVRDAFLEVRRSNRGAMALYQQLGFECVGTRRGYYQAQDGREDALVYRLELGTLAT